MDKNLTLEQLINELQTVINEAKMVPLSGKAMIDKGTVFEILDDMRECIPNETREAKKIVNNRKQIIAEATREGENIIRAAEERKKALLNQNELVREAQAKAKEIKEDGKRKSDEMRKAAGIYIGEMIKQTEDGIAKQLEAIRQTKANIVNLTKQASEEE